MCRLRRPVQEERAVPEEEEREPATGSGGQVQVLLELLVQGQGEEEQDDTVERGEVNELYCIRVDVQG